MDKKIILQALKKAKESSKERKFKQSIDLIFNLKGLNMKKTEDQVEFFASLHYSLGKKVKICALVGPELIEQAKKACETAVLQTDFDKYSKDKKLTKKLAKSHDFFIAQANIMPQVATAFGRVLGPKGKMPNPKAGCVVPPNANLSQLVERLQKMVKISAKEVPLIQCMVGKEDMPEEEIIDNILSVYNQTIHNLPQETNNVDSFFIKLTMGRSVLVGEKVSKSPSPEKKSEVNEPEKKQSKEKPKQGESPSGLDAEKRKPTEDEIEIPKEKSLISEKAEEGDQ